MPEFPISRGAGYCAAGASAGSAYYGASPALDIDLSLGRLRQEQLGQFVDGGARFPGRMGVVG